MISAFLFCFISGGTGRDRWETGGREGWEKVDDMSCVHDKSCS